MATLASNESIALISMYFRAATLTNYVSDTSLYSSHPSCVVCWVAGYLFDIRGISPEKLNNYPTITQLGHTEGVG